MNVAGRLHLDAEHVGEEAGHTTVVGGRNAREHEPFDLHRVIGCPDAPGADDRGAGGRDVGALARARAGVRAARRRGPVPLRPLPLSDRPEPRGPRRLGGHSRARGEDGADRARHARFPGHLPAARGARERLADRLRDLRRPCLARHGDRLDGGRARGVRVPVPGDEDPPHVARGADRGGPRFLGRRSAPAPDRRRQRALRHGRACCEVGRRIQHRDGDAGGVRRASREARPGVRARGPRADPTLVDDRVCDRPRRGRGEGANPPPPRAWRPERRSRGVQGDPWRSDHPRHDRGGERSASAPTRTPAWSASCSSTSTTPTSRWSS